MIRILPPQVIRFGRRYGTCGTRRDRATAYWLAGQTTSAVAKLVLEPIFEADFEDNAYGYRPARGAVDRIFSGVCRLITNRLFLTIFESTPEVRALRSAGITRPRRSYDPVRLRHHRLCPFGEGCVSGEAIDASTRLFRRGSGHGTSER
jgi:hypothetical protein